MTGPRSKPVPRRCARSSPPPHQRADGDEQREAERYGAAAGRPKAAKASTTLSACGAVGFVKTRHFLRYGTGNVRQLADVAHVVYRCDGHGVVGAVVEHVVG